MSSGCVCVCVCVCVGEGEGEGEVFKCPHRGTEKNCFKNVEDRFIIFEIVLFGKNKYPLIASTSTQKKR